MSMIPREGPELDRAAERMFGLTRKPGESDLELRKRVVRALADPVQNARAAARAWKRLRGNAIEGLVRDGAPVEEAVSIAHGEMFTDAMAPVVPLIEQMESLIEGGTMAGIEMRAPVNPYRTPMPKDELLAAEMGFGPYTPAPRRHDRDGGPGLLGSDLNWIAQQHYRDGYAAAEREGEQRIATMQGNLADAYDEGYVAGRIERAQGLAQDYHVRLMEPAVQVTILETVMSKPRSTKAEIAEAVARVRTAMDELRRFAEAMMDDPRKSLVDDPHTETG